MGPPRRRLVVPRAVLALLVAATAVVATGPRHILFMKAPTSGALPNRTWSMLQQNPSTAFTAQHLRDMMALVGQSSQAENAMIRVGVTFQWELLDCFLSPHDCTPEQVADGIGAFLRAAVAANVPVEITLDPVQFYYASNLWNWWDPGRPGFDPNNVDNVEWTGWDASSAMKIAWRDWGSQFRMPTPQPNLASPALLNATRGALAMAVGAIRAWYEACTSDAQKNLLVGVKLGEEVDVGANFYYYKGGNALLNASASDDPTHGPDWSKGLFGGLPAVGYNMLRTLNIRASGGAPTRREITMGVQNYFARIIDACLQAWPALADNGLLVAHAGHVEDPLLIEWSAPMVKPAMPGYSFYFGPGDFAPGKPSPVGQPGLRDALAAYHNVNQTKKKADMRYVVAESACFGCGTVEQWKGYFDAVFSETMNPYGKVAYLRYYNIEPFANSPGAVEALRQFVAEFEG
jgi:hypothetical protein